jgi:uncharacterized protein YbbC (DUF1343 family)
MKKLLFTFILLLLVTSFTFCGDNKKIPVPGANQIELYRSVIEGKSVAVVANQTSMIGSVHLVDKLLSIGINIKVIFAPEHGFRNLADAGASISVTFIITKVTKDFCDSLFLLLEQFILLSF